MAQQGGAWISGEGLYPTNRLEDETDFYDLIQVASLLEAEGESEIANSILKPEFKLIQITSNAPFQVTYYNYLRYNYGNR